MLPSPQGDATWNVGVFVDVKEKAQRGFFFFSFLSFFLWSVIRNMLRAKRSLLPIWPIGAASSGSYRCRLGATEEGMGYSCRHPISVMRSCCTPGKCSGGATSGYVREETRTNAECSAGQHSCPTRLTSATSALTILHLALAKPQAAVLFFG